MLTAMLMAAAAVAGYWTGRMRIGRRVLDWAEDQDDNRRWYDPRLWMALPVLAATLAWIWTVHPRRTRANVRANRAWLNAPTQPRRPHPHHH